MPRIYINDWPPFSPPDISRRNNVIEAAKLIVNAAMTAPNAGGVSQVEAEIVYGMEEQEQIARKMEELAHEESQEHIAHMYKYEAVMVREADCIVFLGDFRAIETPMDAGCGFCYGVDDCRWLYTKHPSYMGLIDATDRRSTTVVKGPLCGVRIQDFGYAIGSAMWMAFQLLVDARPYYTVGVAGQKLGYCPNSPIVVGILLAALSKNPFVDVNTAYHLVNMGKLIDAVRKTYILFRQSGGDYRLSDPWAEMWRERKRKEKEKKEK